MKKIKKIHNYHKKEDSSIVPLLSWWITRGLKIDKYEAIPEDGSISTPDYLVNENCFVEIKKLHDNTEVKQSAQWNTIINKLKKILSTKFKEQKITGLYGIETPRIFKLHGDQKFNQTAEDILKGIKDGKDSVCTNGATYTIKKIDNDYNEIYLSSSWGGVVNPAGTIFQNITSKLNTANKQLGYPYKDYKINKKYILIVNKYVYTDRISETIEGLSYCYQDFLDYENINEIWLQQEMQNGDFDHALIYSQDFIIKFDKKMIEPDNKIHQEQFELWYWALDKLGNKQDKLFDALKKFLEKHKPEDIFSDKFKREAMVRLGIWLIENDRANDAIWLINKFIDDPDPGAPNEYKGDDKFDYHKQLENNEDPTIITTVMGHLAWTVQALAIKSKEKDTNNLIKAYKFTEQVLENTENLYVIQQWIVPLVEIAHRRLWIAEKDIDLYKRFRSLLLDKKDGLVLKYGGIPGIAKYMANIFSNFKDLTTEEAKLILSKISHVDQAMSVLIYFGIYRSSHYKKSDSIGKKFGKIEPEIWDYNPGFAIATLQGIIKENREDHRMQTIAWNFWKIIKDDPKQFDNLKEWVGKLYDLPANFSVFPYLQFILEDNIVKHPTECKLWLKKLLSATEKYVNKKSPTDFIRREVLHIPKTIDWLKSSNYRGDEKIKNCIEKFEKIGILIS